MDWNFKREERKFDEVTAGTHRIRIADVEKTTSQSGNDMLKITFDVSGTKATLRHYIVFLPEQPEITNRNLTSLFDSFGIADGDFNLINWVGKVGACEVKIDEEYGAKVRYFINKGAKQDRLPPWQEGGDEKPSVASKPNMQPVDDFPF